jgi:hypothetical protein
MCVCFYFNIHVMLVGYIQFHIKHNPDLDPRKLTNIHPYERMHAIPV